VVGDDFRFGAERRGTLEDLRAAGRRFGFGVTEVPPVFRDGERVSSTAIREALKSGDLDAARSMLGRDYSISGRVVRGLGLGKQLGFPTANVNLKRLRAPVDGIFAARITGLGPERLDGVASVGTRPTIGGSTALLEVLVFDFDRDIYGKYITVHFVKRLREERHFADLEAMRRQMQRDVADARAALTA
jgi:riboflavin kinase/FMN adenylyltransferase